MRRLTVIVSGNISHRMVLSLFHVLIVLATALITGMVFAAELVLPQGARHFMRMSRLKLP